MKGVILAGGLGSRLFPLTKVTNKHLLPIYNQPMIYYPINTLLSGGISEVLVVTGEAFSNSFKDLIKREEFGLNHIEYAVQKGEGGIADALKLAKDFVGDESFAVCLGDNIFDVLFPKNPGYFRQLIQSAQVDKLKRAMIFLKAVEDPNRFGVAKIDADNKILGIVEKPVEEISKLAVTGLYIYPPDVFDVINTLKPSERGELEITDVNNYYINKKRMWHEIIQGFWTDAGTYDSLFLANTYVAMKAHPKYKQKFQKVLNIL